MSAELAPEPPCQWATCDDTPAEPGSLYCHQHGRQARLEGAPWRRPGAPVERRAEAVTHRRVDAGGNTLPLASTPAPIEQAPADDLFTRPPATRRPSAPPPEAPAAASCRRCDEPALAKTLSAKPNRWSNLCEAHYTEARRNALGTRRREQLAAVLPARDPAPPAPALDGPGPSSDGPGPSSVVAIPDAYADRAATLVELGAEVDDARAALAAALTRWAEAVEALR